MEPKTPIGSDRITAKRQDKALILPDQHEIDEGDDDEEDDHRRADLELLPGQQPVQPFWDRDLEARCRLVVRESCPVDGVTARQRLASATSLIALIACPVL